jgi:8-oxo-dGTP diphosphatase
LVDRSARTMSIAIVRGIAAYYNPIEVKPQPGEPLSSDPQGTKDAGGRYQFIARTLIFVYRDSKVLLLKGTPHKRLWANRYNGIGGHVEQGESIPDSVLRELREEAGITVVTDLRMRGVITIDPNTNPGILIFVFKASTEQSSIETSDEGTPEWINWRLLPSEVIVEDLPVLLDKLDLMLPSEPPFHAHYTYDESGTLSIHFADQ